MVASWLPAAFKGIQAYRSGRNPVPEALATLASTMAQVGTRNLPFAIAAPALNEENYSPNMISRWADYKGSPLSIAKAAFENMKRQTVGEAGVWGTGRMMNSTRRMLNGQLPAVLTTLDARNIDAANKRNASDPDSLEGRINAGIALEAQNAKPNDIYNEKKSRGFYRVKDGPRLEVPDDMSPVISVAPFRLNQPYSVRALLNSKMRDQAYGKDWRKLKYQFSELNPFTYGQYDPDTGLITFNSRHYLDQNRKLIPDRIYWPDNPELSFMGTVLHENDHWAQEHGLREGGSNPSISGVLFDPFMSASNDALRDLFTRRGWPTEAASRLAVGITQFAENTDDINSLRALTPEEVQYYGGQAEIDKMIKELNDANDEILKNRHLISKALSSSPNDLAEYDDIFANSDIYAAGAVRDFQRHYASAMGELESYATALDGLMRHQFPTAKFHHGTPLYLKRLNSIGLPEPEFPSFEMHRLQ